MKTLILQSENESDISLLMDLARRLGVQFFESQETETIVPTENTSVELPNSSILLEGLGLEKEVKAVSWEEFQNDKSLPYDENYIPDIQNAQKYFGAWQDDDSETLEELLNMLTP